MPLRAFVRICICCVCMFVYVSTFVYAYLFVRLCVPVCFYRFVC